MTSITVRFEGLCTHLIYPYPPEPPWVHRVVMPKAFPNFPAHTARLIIPLAAATVSAVRAFAALPHMRYEGVVHGNHHVALEGVELEIANATGPYQQQLSFLCGIPRLSRLAGKWLGEPKAAVANARSVDETWAYFNVRTGTWSAGLVHEGASAAVLECETDGAPMLSATGFRPSLPGPALKLEAGHTLTVQHVSENDEEHDFGIHYRIVHESHRPPKLPIPAKAACLEQLPTPAPAPPGQSIGPGCSNSTFP